MQRMHVWCVHVAVRIDQEYPDYVTNIDDQQLPYDLFTVHSTPE